MGGRGSGRGRGRGRGRGIKRRTESEYGENFKNYHHQSHNTIHRQSSTDYQDYPFSPPFSHRFSRESVLTSPRCSKKPFPSHNSSLRPTIIITLDEDDAKPEQHNHTSQAQPTPHGKEKETDEPSVELISEIRRPQETGSSFNSACEYVHGHKVKTEFAPLLRAIFDKHGDITRGNNVTSPDLLSIFLERICHVYQRLERTKFLDLTRAELEDMISELRLFERHKVSVRWILERVEYISQTKNSFQDHQRVREKEAKLDASIGRLEKDLEAYEREVCKLQQKISSTKAELVMHKAKNDQIKEGESDIMARVIALQKQSLVHGFL